MTKTRLEIEGHPGSFFEAEVKGSELHIHRGEGAPVSLGGCTQEATPFLLPPAQR